MTSKSRIKLLIYTFVIASALIASRSLFPFLLDILTIDQLTSKADAIVLVAGNMKERLPAAARLYNENYAPLIVLANGGIVGEWSTKMNRNLLHIELAEERLVKLGVPRESIIKLPYYGSSTMFDALAVRDYLVKSGLKKIVIVTSDYHTRRALWTFKYVLKKYTSKIYISPAKTVGIDVQILMLEYLKLGYYLIRYGMFGLVPQLNENTVDPLKNTGFTFPEFSDSHHA